MSFDEDSFGVFDEEEIALMAGKRGVEHRAQSAPPFSQDSLFGEDSDFSPFRGSTPTGSPIFFAEVVEDFERYGLSSSPRLPDEGFHLKMLRNKIEELKAKIKLLEENLRHEEERTKITLRAARARCWGRIMKLTRPMRTQEDAARTYAEAMFEGKEKPTHALLIAEICMKLETTLKLDDSAKMQHIRQTVTEWVSSSSGSAKN